MASSASVRAAVVVLLVLLFHLATALAWGTPVCNEIVPGCCAPSLIIVGAMKCGTNAVMAYLAKHPAFSESLTESEVHYLTQVPPIGCNELVAGSRGALRCLTTTSGAGTQKW
eukprot:scaffold74388_cov33-Prasinocladus_malaysianus.AAC.1